VTLLRPRARALAGRSAVAAALGVLLVVLLAAPASAHASLVAIDPPDGARLDAAPAEVRLTFSERVSADLGGVRVLGPDGAQVEQGATTVDGTEVAVALQPDLPEGTYVITYRVVSADGHPVRGASVFGVGDVDLDPGAIGRVDDAGSDRSWEVVGAVGRGLAYGGTLLAAGGVLFLVVVHRAGPERATLLRVVHAAAAAGALGSLVALPVQAALGTGQGPGSLFDPGVLSSVSGDGVGAGVALALAGLALAVAALDRWPVVAVGAAAVAASSFATNGHTRSGVAVAASTAADAVHLLAAAAWGGGLVLLWCTLRARRRAARGDEGSTDAGAAATESSAVLVARFSRLATVAVAGVGLSGLVLTWSQVGSFDGLTTGYGWLLISKVSLVVAIGVLALYNHLRLVPAMARGKATAALAQLRATVRLEALVLVPIVALTAVLVVVTPARTDLDAGLVEEVVELGEAGSVQITVAPARAGFNQIHLYLFDPDGRPAEIAESITLELSLPAAEIGPIAREATRAGPAHLQLDGTDLAVAGTWEVVVRARIDRFTEATGTIEVPVAG
jgi:copper transport protein